MKMTKELADKILAEAKEALTPVAKKHGLNMLPHRGTYSEGQLNLRFSFEIEGGGDRMQNLRRFAPSHGIIESRFGETIELQGRKFVLTGYNPRARTRPFLAKCLNDGKIYKLDRLTVEGWFR